jgi:methylmalonyl-CoA/ethylmalonyl-CoA epimerase
MDKGWELNHVGLMVTNRDAALKYFQSLGMGVSVGPQPLLPHEDGHGALTLYRTLNGNPVTLTYPTGGAHDFSDGETHIGDCQLECYGMAPGPGTFISEYLDQKGPGINHICFNVPDAESVTQKLVDKGCGVVFNATVNEKIVEDYLDTRKFGDVILSFRPPANEWEKAWKANNMAHPLVSDWKFDGLGIGVQDLDKTVAYYDDLGFTDIEPEIEDTSLNARTRRVHVGPLVFEFVQPTAEGGIYHASLDRRGDGVNDICFTVVDLERETAKLRERGATVLLRSNAADPGAFAIVDTREVGNIMTRLVQA